jgi:hypothetical protein
MKKFFVFIVCVLSLSISSFAQQTSEVNSKGIGVKREDALQDALRNAVSQAVGVVIRSETKVENFEVLQDAIATKTEGYISSYNVIKEGLIQGRYEMDIRAIVSLSPLRADVNLLAQSIGGIRFLVMYDERSIKPEEKENYDFAAERINNFLSERKYRYIDKRRFESLKKEATNMLQEDLGELTYVQQLGVMADAQFIIFISKIHTESRSEAFDTRTASKVTIEAKAFDNCTGEGLGTVILESDWKNARDLNSTLRAGISEAVAKDFTKLIFTFNSYIGDWVNNGTPYELRFYSSGTFRDFRELRNKLKNDPNFGGQMEVVNVNNFTKLNCTFKKKPDQLADRVLDIADEVAAFKEKNLDVKFIYGRQISFAPHNVKIDTPLPAQQEPTDQRNAEQKSNETRPVNNAQQTTPVKTNNTQPASSNPAPAKTTSTPTKSTGTTPAKATPAQPAKPATTSGKTSSKLKTGN